MWALPRVDERATSAWSSGAPGSDAALARPDEVDGEPLEQTTPLRDPPYVQDGEVGVPPEADARQLAPLVLDTRPAPPTIGLRDARATTVQLVKRDGAYATVVDGVQVGRFAPPKEALTEARHWLPRFREVRDEARRRVPGPLCVGVRLEEGEIAPHRVEVQMVQRIVDHDNEVLRGEVVRRETVGAHSVEDLTAPFALLPYPATITRQPFVRIYDADARRRWEFARSRWQKGRRWAILRKIVWDNTNLSGNGAWRRLAGALLSGKGLKWAPLWRAALTFVSPRMNRLVQTALEFKTLAYNGYESVRAPPDPDRIKPYDYSIPELAASLRRIAATRADGSTNGRPWGFTPGELSRAGHPEDGALLYWLVYGESSTVEAARLAAEVEGEPDTQGSLRRLWSRVTQRPSWAYWSLDQSQLTGNFLDPRGLDPRVVARTYVAYDVVVEIEETPGAPVQRVSFRPLHAHGVDAGYLFVHMEEQLQELKEAVDAVTARLRTLASYGNTWIHRRLLVPDSTQGEWFGGVRALVGRVTNRDRQRAAQWRLQRAEQRRQSLRGTPMLLDVEGFRERMLGLLGQPAPPDAEQRRSRAVSSLAALPARLRGTQWLTADVYGQLLVALARLFLSAMGVAHGDDATSADADVAKVTGARLFWRWIDHYAPYLPPDDEALAAFVVPPSPYTTRVPVLVRRLPQLGVVASKVTSIFGRTALLPVAAVPADPLSARTAAKVAVTVTRRCWKNALESYRQVCWVVETESPLGVPSAFHFVQLHGGDARTIAARLRALPQLRAAAVGTDLLCVHGGQPVAVSAGEQVAEAFATQSTVRAKRNAAGTRRGGDAALLRRCKLEESRAALGAVAAYAGLVAARAAAHGTRLTRESLVFNCAQEAQRLALQAADVIELVYGERAGSQLVELVSRDDAVFACLPQAAYARVLLEQLDVWVGAQARLAASRRFDEPDDFGRSWRAADRRSASAFASALRTLAQRKEPPTDLPVMALQCMWVADNPAIERLLPADPVASSGLELQVSAAVRSHQRVAGLLEAGLADAAAHAALACAVAGRPINLVAWTLGPVRERVARALRAAAVPTPRRQPPAATPFDQRALLARSAALRLDTTLAYAGEDAASVVDIGELVRRMAVLSTGGRAEYHVPFGCPLAYDATPRDLSYVSELEEVPVWSEAVAAAADALELVPPQSSPPPVAVRARPLREGGRARHPHLVDTDGAEWGVHLHPMPPLVAPRAWPRGVSDSPPPIATQSAADTLALLEAWTGEGEPSPTRALRERARAVLWDVDRFVQVLLLLHTAPVPLEAPQLRLPDEWPDGAVGAAAACLALALGTLGQQRQLRTRLALAVRTDAQRAAAAQALGALRRAFGSEAAPAAAPLSEVALVLAARLP